MKDRDIECPLFFHCQNSTSANDQFIYRETQFNSYKNIENRDFSLGSQQGFQGWARNHNYSTCPQCWWLATDWTISAFPGSMGEKSSSRKVLKMQNPPNHKKRKKLWSATFQSAAVLKWPSSQRSFTCNIQWEALCILTQFTRIFTLIFYWDATFT